MPGETVSGCPPKLKAGVGHPPNISIGEWRDKVICNYGVQPGEIVKQIIQLAIYGEPVAQPRASKFFNPKTGRMHGYVKQDHPIHLWKSNLQMTASVIVNDGDWTFSRRPNRISLLVNFHFSRPASMPKWLGLGHFKKPDADNLIKAVKDALRGILYEDDSQVDWEQAYKVYVADSPHCDIWIMEKTIIQTNCRCVRRDIDQSPLTLK
jgi:Holliday junction resolvase RusA-like endonuclease